MQVITIPHFIKNRRVVFLAERTDIVKQNLTNTKGNF